MNKTRIIFLMAFLFICCCFCLYSAIISKDNDLQDKTSVKIEKIEKKDDSVSEVCFKNNCFQVEIADTAEERVQGLMKREYLGSNKGMLFIFDTENSYGFWMKDTLISLDIVWFNENKEVVFIKHKAEPCETEQCEIFEPSENAKYVLEVNGGLAEEIGLKQGNILEFRK